MDNATRQGCGPKRPWTDEDEATLRTLYGKKTCQQIGRLLMRSAASVQQHAQALGLSRKYGPDPALLAYVAQEHAAGRLDTEIASGWQAMHPELYVCRESVSYYRRKVLGLPINEHRRLEVRRDAQRKQMAVLRISSFADLARRRHRRFVLQSGWPIDLKPLEVRVLNVLAERGGYMTRKEIARGIGCRSPDQRDWFKCGYGSQTALGNLMRRGLIRRSNGRTRKGQGKGGSSYEYWIPLDVLRKYRKPKSMLA
jgi:DNA-binding CsgD family transcriptional regulator